jgi:hypothetical protein
MTTNTTTQLMGATYSTDKADFGRITSTFPVSQDWDGYKHHGYCWAPSNAQI